MSIERLLPLEGGRNFRDLGGYETADGRRVRWGRLYRSGVLSYLSDVDHDRLVALDIRVLCDLRTARERAREPTQWRNPHTAQLSWNYDPSHTSLRSYLAQAAEYSAETTRQSMLTLYRNLPTLFTPQYRELFARVARAELPVVFHCSAGKDRTGLAAALILTSLGVPRPTVIADYALTDQLVDLEHALFRHPRGSIGVGDEFSALSSVDPAARAPLLRAMPEYLEAAFAQIERNHGSVESYLSSELGVTQEAAAALRLHLLED
jgi:protein-tyrosine phosphatase